MNVVLKTIRRISFEMEKRNSTTNGYGHVINNNQKEQQDETTNDEEQV